MQGYQRVRDCNETERITPMSSSAYFATGCFWGAERRFWQIEGVIETSVGYMGGSSQNPTYEEVCTGKTGHAEMVKVIFDESKVTYQRLLEEFWTMHDPTSLNQQGGDIGTQYRSAIYTTTPLQYVTAVTSRDVYQAVLTEQALDQIVTEIVSAEGLTYFMAEEYHQKYLIKNPNGYDCHSSTGVAYPTVGVSA
ncbi:MAG: peptide-methionine (S)-S-oxide reductase MsrA [Actinobacteria bacterium]|nr:peptide-methionine (S)-S-oxide reductase MsrA [Actinomycetota bacterium]